MSWSNSKVHAPFILNALDRASAFDLDGDTLKNALYDNTPTPDNTVSAANSAYDVDQWASANEVDDSTEWDAGGEPLANNDVAVSATTITLDADDTVSGGSSATLADVFGCLIYDDTLASPVADQGICYLYLGGANSVVNGTFTVVYSGSGILNISVA